MKFYTPFEYQQLLLEKAEEIENYVFSVLMKRRECELELPTFNGLLDLIVERCGADNILFIQGPLQRGIHRFLEAVRLEKSQEERTLFEKGLESGAKRDRQIAALETLWDLS